MSKITKTKNLGSKLIGCLLVLVLGFFACSNLLLTANALGATPAPSTGYYFDGYSQGLSAEEVHKQTLLGGAVKA